MAEKVIDSLLSLRDRLVLIAAREVDDRALSSGEAQSVVDLIDATRDDVAALGCACDELNKALKQFRVWT
jgi:hypothetical protein